MNSGPQPGGRSGCQTRQYFVSSQCRHRTGLHCHAPVCEENPKNFFLWQVHGRIARARLSTATSCIFDQCSFGALCRKNTRMDFWHATLPPPFSACCHGRTCIFTGATHLRLSGLSNGTFVTAHAATYPEKLAGALANTLADACVAREVNGLWRTMLNVPPAKIGGAFSASNTH